MKKSKLAKHIDGLKNVTVKPPSGKSGTAEVAFIPTLRKPAK